MANFPSIHATKLIYITIGSILLVLIFLTYNRKHGEHRYEYKKIESFLNPPQDKNSKTILLWTGFFSSRTWYLPGTNVINNSYFEKENCPTTNCVVTTLKKYFDNLTQFDAIVFHGLEAFKKPTVRSEHQQYILGLLESPGHSGSFLRNHQNFFNLTMTYRLDSDIPWTYARIYDKLSGKIVAPSKAPSWPVPSHNFNDVDLQNITKNKDKFGAWFVSHCNAMSRRDKLVRSLKKYLSIDIYGKCGTLNCPPSSAECDMLLDKNYKFYFSLENSLCKDYVTEKFYNALKRQIIPVVFGGADYSQFAPPNSYINANDFENIEDLATYLLYVSKNPQEYIKYFWWKKHFRISTRSPFCDLCIRLNDPAAGEKIQFYRNIEDWWFKNSCSLKPSITF